MSLEISESEFNKKYKYGKVRGYVDYEESPETFIVYNQTLTPNEGGDKAIYRVCETESEAIALVRILNTIFESVVTVEFTPVDDPNTEDSMTYEHQMVQWAYA